MINRGKVAYTPNGLAGGFPAEDPEHGFTSYTEKMEGRKIRERSESFRDYYSQAQLFWNSMSKPEKRHIIKAFQFEVGKVKDAEIRQKVVDMFANVDLDLASQIAEGVGATMPSKGADASTAGQSPAVSMENTAKDSIMSRRIAVLAAEGANDKELMRVKKALEDAGGHVKIISKSLSPLKSESGKDIPVDMTFLTAASVMFDAVIAASGPEDFKAINAIGDAVHFINEAFKHCKPIGALGEGVDLLAASDISGAKVAAAGTEDRVVSDKGVVTARRHSGSFDKSFIDAVAMHRHWVREPGDEVPA
jgi:catalase